MSDKALKNVLKDFGLTETESETYLLLALHGTLKGAELAKLIRKDKAQVYHILKRIQSKGLVESTLEVPVHFTAIPFERVLDSTIKAKRDEAAKIEGTKLELLKYWQNLSKTKLEMSTEKFMVIEGRHNVYSKVAQMIEKTKKQLLTVAGISSLLRADTFGLYTAASRHDVEPKIAYRFLTELGSKDMRAIKSFLETMSLYKFNFRVRNADLSGNISVRMVIRDNEEAVFFITPRGDPLLESDELCLWTNCRDLVQAFTLVFEDQWRNSTDIEKKITEIESGKPSPKTIVINDAHIARKNYEEALISAKKEIIAVTSQDGLLALSKNKDLLQVWTQRGVHARILGPITSITQQHAQILMKTCEVRHIPNDYIQTTIMDESHLFEFVSVSKDENSVSGGELRNAFYSNDQEYVGKTLNMLNYVWQTAQVPSAITLGSINAKDPSEERPFFEETVPRTIKKMYGSQITSYEKPGRLSQRDIVNKMITPKSEQNSGETVPEVKTYGTNCQAIVRLPTEFNVPNLLIHIYHMEKHSTFGPENVVILHPWLQTPQGYAYVLSATFTDNPKALAFWKKASANSPAEQNVHLLKEDTLEVRVHGSTLFAGWTVPLPLNQFCTIPPSCLLVEGYGKITTSAYTVKIPSGYKLKTEGNHSEAFVTFLHPSSKYSGPGTDGGFARDTIMEFYHP